MNISIIIPVYNVQDYLMDCVKSIIDNQDMEGIEILLIDDGSSDKSGYICDKLAENYSYIKAYHKKNGGLSSARNAGINLAEGKWITFIDSDDLVSKRYIQDIKAMSKLTNYDVFIYKHINFRGKINNSTDNTSMKLEDITKEQAMYTLHVDEYGNYAWNKLYKKFLFNNIKYPIQKTYEDIFTTYKLYDIANKIALIDNFLYYYRQRPGSIVYSKDISKKINMFKDRYIAEKELNDFFVEKYPSCQKQSEVDLLRYSLVLCTYTEIYDREKDEIFNQAKHFLKSHVVNLKSNKIKLEFLILLYKKLPRLYQLSMGQILKLRNRKKK